MWRRLFIFLVVLVFVVSSVWCYPSWVYGKGKESLKTEQTVLEEEETLLLEAPERLSKKERKLQKEDLKDSVGNLKAFAKESIEDEAMLEVISEYIASVEDGIKVMETAYNAEVENAKKAEDRYNRLADAYANDKGVDYKESLLKDFSITVNPFMTYAPKTNSIGLGGMVGVGYKDIALTVGAINPSIDSLKSLINLDDVMVSVGVAFTF